MRRLQQAAGMRMQSDVNQIFVKYDSCEISRTTDSLDLSVYHTKAQLPGRREGLLVDPGAHSNLTGDRWLRRCDQLSRAHGHSVAYRPLEKPQGVEGVGKGSQECTQEAEVPLAFGDGSHGRYITPVVPDSDVPALLGLKTLKERRCVMDCYNGVLYEVAAGSEYQLTLPNESKVYALEPAVSGHWMLPVTEWPAGKKGDRY